MAMPADPLRPPGPALLAGCFVALARGEAGTGRPGDRAFAAAVVWEPGHDVLRRRGRGGMPVRSGERALRGTRRGGPRQAADVVAQTVVEAAAGGAYGPRPLAPRGGAVPAAPVAPL